MRATSKKTYIKKIRRKTVTSKGLSIDRIEHNFNIVMSHLRQTGTYKQTLTKHNALCIYAAVKRCLENSVADSLDIAVLFEELRDYDNIDDFMKHLEEQHFVSKTYRDDVIEDMALTELEEHASVLGKKIVSKHAVMLEENEVAIPEIDYFFLKRRDAQLKKLEVASGGWPLSLV